MARLFWLSDEAWKATEPHLPRSRLDKSVCMTGG